MISLLVPSRGRFQMFTENIKTWMHPDVEILVAIDDDDPDAPKYLDIRSKQITVYQLPRHGYQNLHEYYNFLSQASSGDWLMLGNDDATMLTDDWVSKIQAENPKLPQVLNVWNEQDNLFPVISRAWYNAVGHFSRNTHADSWVQQTAELINKTKYIPGIKIKHLGEELNDETHREVRSIVGQSSEAYRRMSEERREDARKVNEYIKSRGLE
jgi:hypothetical protein